MFWLAPAMLATLFAAWQPGDDGVVICPTKRLCGVWCPGCGMTRAVSHLLRGDWSTAFVYHPLAPIAVAEVVVGWVVVAGAKIGWWSRPSNRTILAVLIFNVVALTLVWVLRLNNGSFDDLR